MPGRLRGELSLQGLHLGKAGRLQPGRFGDVLLNVGRYGESAAQLLHLGGPKLKQHNLAELGGSVDESSRSGF